MNTGTLTSTIAVAITLNVALKLFNCAEAVLAAMTKRRRVAQGVHTQSSSLTRQQPVQ